MFLSKGNYKNILFSLAFLLILPKLSQDFLPLLFPLAAAFLVSALLQKPVSFLKKRFRIPKKLSALFFIIVFITLFSAGIFLIFNKVREEFDVFYVWIEKFDFNIISGLIGKIPAFFSSIGDLFPKILISLSILLFSSFYLTSEYEDLSEFIHSKIKKDSIFFRIIKVMKALIFGYFKLYSILFLFTFAFLFLSFNILKLRFSLILALIISIFDILPVVGTGTVLVPWGVYEICLGSRELGIKIIIVFLLLSIIKEIIQPKILGDFVGLHPLLSVVAISAGFLYMGITGAFLFPLALCVGIEISKERT
ncbi:MAG: AI-2E family transporter [Clostridia bacterium]|nr:AI-2E family transporter [Clostridia bacterium]